MRYSKISQKMKYEKYIKKKSKKKNYIIQGPVHMDTCVKSHFDLNCLHGNASVTKNHTRYCRLDAFSFEQCKSKCFTKNVPSEPMWNGPYEIPCFVISKIQLLIHGFYLTTFSNGFRIVLKWKINFLKKKATWIPRKCRLLSFW